MEDGNQRFEEEWFDVVVVERGGLNESELVNKK